MITFGSLAFMGAAEQNIYTATNVVMKINQKDLPNGSLYLTENALCWKPNDRDDCISISWEDITCHAISPTPSRCIYLILDASFIWNGVYELSDAAAYGRNRANAREGGGDEAAVDGAEENDDDGPAEDGEEVVDEGNVSDEESIITEIWLIPQEPSHTDEIFAKMTDCQNVNPDQYQSDEADSFLSQHNGFGVASDNSSDMEEGPNENMQNLNLSDDERFADAEE